MFWWNHRPHVGIWNVHRANAFFLLAPSWASGMRRYGLSVSRGSESAIRRLYDLMFVCARVVLVRRAFMRRVAGIHTVYHHCDGLPLGQFRLTGAEWSLWWIGLLKGRGRKEGGLGCEWGGERVNFVDYGDKGGDDERFSMRIDDVKRIFRGRR